MDYNSIEYNLYGTGEYSVQYAGDDIFFATFDEAKAFIDETHAECCHDMEITRAEATYTGGGIYIYTGQFASGNFFMTDDDWATVCINILDADPYENLDEACCHEWQDAHTLCIITDREAAELSKQILTKAEMLDIDKEVRLAKLA